MSEPPRPTAVVFDLDGVITFTDSLHFTAWKDVFDDLLERRAEPQADGGSFRPLSQEDYRAQVDGRPRHDGIRAFLASRDIELPEGEPDDPPDRETVRGLGNRKNAIFQEELRREEVEVASAAVRLARNLARADIRVGLASSSKNARRILEAAELNGLFDSVVDGIVSEKLDLRGKPAPDIFLECLRRLGELDPGTAVVVEDAAAGVEAGRAGNFGLVLGVDRGDDAIELRERGADWVVEDLDEVTVEDLRSWFQNLDHRLPNALARWPALVRELDGAAPTLFLDYDGTLTPLVDRPDQAVLSDPMRTTLRRLASTWPTVVVSGRELEDVRALVDLGGVNFAASHGFDLSGPDVDESLRPDVADEVVPAITSAANRVVELRPAGEWDKGRAILWLLEALGLEDDACPIYIGDDVTNEDAFRVVSDRGVGILVSALPRPSEARYSLQNVREVRELLDRVTSLADSVARRSGRRTMDDTGASPEPSEPDIPEDEQKRRR